MSAFITLSSSAYASYNSCPNDTMKMNNIAKAGNKNYISAYIFFSSSRTLPNIFVHNFFKKFS